MKPRICVVTGSRADYGLLCWVMKKLAARSCLEMVPAVTGAHLHAEWGNTVEQIKKDGFRNLREIKTSKHDTSRHEIAASMAETLENFSEFLSNENFSLVVLLGDRFEILAAASAALVHNIPVAHIGGGEISEGAIDDSIRHALTKMSRLHFVITEQCARRVIRMGEAPETVFTVGSPRLDYISGMKFKSKEELERSAGIEFSEKNALVIFHPATAIPEDAGIRTDSLLDALGNTDFRKIFLYPNIDVNSSIILDKIRGFTKSPGSNSVLLKPLPLEDYLGIMKNVDLMIGNSSAGIVEAPLFELPVVNIGDRQKGRDCMKNVIHADCGANAIRDGIEKALSPEFRNSLSGMINIYGDGQASDRIADIISNINWKDFSALKKNYLD